MALGGEGYFHANYYHTNYWHVDYWFGGGVAEGARSSAPIGGMNLDILELIETTVMVLISVLVL